MRFRLAVTALLAVLFSAHSSWAVNPINFEGPKKTYKDEVNKVLFLWPGDFAVLNNVKGSANPKPDVVVPMLFPQRLLATDTVASSYARTIGGLLWDGDNRDNWPSVTDNTYFNNHYETNDTLAIPQQVVAGQFDGESASPGKVEKDLVVVNWAGHISLCYNYVDAASPLADCESVSDRIYSDTKGIPLRAAVGDFNGDGRDDVAVIGLSIKRDPFALQGFLNVYYSSNAGGANPLTLAYTYLFDNGLPLSLALSDYDGDGKLDIVTAQMPFFWTTGSMSAFLSYFKFTGGAIPNPFTQSPSIDFSDCFLPTGLVASDLDADTKADLTLTCYVKMSGTPCPLAAVAAPAGCGLTRDSGPVILIKSNNNGTFTHKLSIPDTGYPYTTAVGDFNGDSKPDFAVAENGANAVRILAGTGPFQVELPGSSISAAPFRPKYIQTADMNADGLTDLVLTAAAGIPFMAREARTDTQPEPQAVALLARDTKDYTLSFYGSDSNTPFVQGADYYPYVVSDTSTFDNVSIDGGVTSYLLNNSSTANYANVDAVLTTQELSTSDTNAAPIRSLTMTLLPRDGVLVLINVKPKVLIDQPNCETTTVKVHCAAPAGHNVTTCAFASPDIADAAANYQLAGLNTPNAEGSFTLPKENKKYTFTITYAEDGGTPQIYTFSIDRTNCPGQLACAAPAPKAEVWVDDPWTLCVPGVEAQAVGKQVVWTQTGGADILLDPQGKIAASSVTSDGPCLKGRLKWPENDRTVNFTYTVKDTVSGASLAANCPATVVQKAAIIEGSGKIGCSFNPKDDVAGSGWVWSPLVLLMSLYFFRNRTLKKGSF